MGSDRRQRLLLIAAIICIGALAGDRFVVTPLCNLWKVRSSRISELKVNLTKGALLVDRGDAMRSRWAEMTQRSLPVERPAAESKVLAAVSRWTGASDIKVTSLKPRWIASEKEFTNVEFRVTATGSLGSIAQFLYDMETDPLALRAEDIELTTRDPRGGDLSLALRFTGLVLAESKS